jgi:uncharacterized DUF497 family protein
MSSYDWDFEKGRRNASKHGVTFAEAESVAASPLSRRESDVGHSTKEERVKVIGYSTLGALLVVIVSEGGPRPRIISARRATKRERDAYIG